jgi:hypothetical protein
MRSRKPFRAFGSDEGFKSLPSADNPNPPRRCGIEQERGGRRARLSDRLKPLGTALGCRATVAQRRRVPSEAEKCVRLVSNREVEANGRAPSFWRQHAGAYERCYVDSLVRSCPELMMNRSTAVLMAVERIDS